MTSPTEKAEKPAAQRYSRVFQPFRIGATELKNRIFIPAHTTNFAENFLPSQRHLAYHRERARGGAGLIVIEPLRVHRTSLGRSGGLAGNDHGALPGLRQIVDVINEEGVPAFVQLTHAGRHGDNFVERLPAWGPSSIPWTTSGQIPHAMSRREISEVVACYADAAEIAVEAGFVGMEIHFGHGHLLHQFLSPLSNDRGDDYGGTLENRLRFPMEALRAVIQQVGGRASVGVRLSVDELLVGGLGPDESREIAQCAAEEPGVSFINASVSSYNWPSIGYHVADMSAPAHPYLDLTVRLREAVGDVPVLTANRYTSLADAEEALATGAIDMVGMMRAHIADPAIIRKTLAGEEDRIRPCIAANFCIEQLAVHRPITCMMNPRVGQEESWPEDPSPVEQPRRILVVGGGPAGMEAARMAAIRGHDVTLWERGSSLGGCLQLAGTGHGRQDLHRMKAYLESELARSGTEIVCNRAADLEAILAADADEVVLATGAVPTPSHLPGWPDVLSAEAALGMDRSAWAGSRVLLHDSSGSWATLSVAETLAHAGARVSLVAKPETVLWDITLYSRMTALERLREAGVHIRAMAEPVRAEDGRVVIRERSLGEESDMGVFTHVVYSAPGRSNLELLDGLEAEGIVVHSIGDAAAPRSLLYAVYEGQALGRRL